MTHSSFRSSVTVNKRMLLAAVLMPLLLVSSFIIPGGQAHAETCTTLTVTSGAQTEAAGYATVDPANGTAGLDAALYSEGSFDGAVVTTPFSSWLDPAVEADFTGSGAVWVSTHDNWPGGPGNTEGVAGEDQWRLFQHTFTIPDDATITDANLWFTGDNAVEAYLNGDDAAIEGTGDVYGAIGTNDNFTEVFDTSFEPVEGENTLSFVVRNWTGEANVNPTGLLYKAAVEYCVPGDEEPPVPGEVATPVHLFPENGRTLNNPELTIFDWSDVTVTAEPVTYIFQMSFDSDTNVDGSFENPWYTSDPLTVSQVSADGTLEGTQYWHVRALDDEGGMSNWSATWSFTLDNDDPTDPPPNVTVTTAKYIDGSAANAVSAAGNSFTISATWNADNIGFGTGQFNLGLTGINTATPYQAVSSEMTVGADYSIFEATNDIVAADCSGDEPYALAGYSTGGSLAAAAAATVSPTAPSLVDITTDQYIIVWNTTCDGDGSTDDGELEGDVDGGVDADGTLQVTSVTVVDNSATADGTFENGWEYVFNITVPNDETNLAMKFGTWDQTDGDGTIAVGGNMRISSSQANNGGATIVLSGADTYSTPALHMTGDLNAGVPGKQVQVTVEVSVPPTTINGSYSTTYGVQTLP